jgi:hypothetical protein
VSACCEITAVLDFGKLIAAGPTAEVLRDDQVVRAYLGTEDEEFHAPEVDGHHHDAGGMHRGGDRP